jgi:EpsI family protein
MLKTLKVSRRFQLHLYLALGLLLLTFLILYRFSQAPNTTPLQTRLQAFPLHVVTWEGRERSLDPNVVTALGLDDWMLRLYQNESRAFVWLYIGFFGYYHFDKGSFHHSPQVCYPAQGWKLIQGELQEINIPEKEKILVNKLLVQKGTERQLVLYWYQWGDRIVTEKNWEDWGRWRDYKLRLYSLLHLPSLLINNDRTDRALVRISAPVIDNVEETLSHEIAFIQAAFPLLVRHFSLDGSSP